MGIFRQIADIFLPPLCVCCRRRLISGETFVCMPCYMSLGMSLGQDDYRDGYLPKMFFPIFPVEAAASGFAYFTGSTMSKLVREFKFCGNKRLAVYMGRQLAQEEYPSQVLANDVDALLPVPISKERMMERGYNQSELLCQGISEVTGIPVVTDVLRRIKHCESQTKFSGHERKMNVVGAFTAENTQQLEGKHVVLFDDIITTGATASECLLQLRGVPGLRVSILSLCLTSRVG